MHRKVAPTTTSNIITRSEFEELQVRAASCDTTLKEFLRGEGVAYSTYNYWNKKTKAEAEPMPIAPISIQKPAAALAESVYMAGVELQG